jgi:hypothetical protein
MDGATYAAQWRDLRWRTWTFVLLFLLFGPVVIVMSKVFPGKELWIFAAWTLIVAVAAFRRALFRCPRCDRPYFSSTFWQNNIARKCMNCGLPRNAEPDDPS